MVTDMLRVTDGSGGELVADRSGDLPILWTTSDGLDGGLGVRLDKTDRIGDGTFTGVLSRPGREITLGGLMHGTRTACRAFVRRTAALWAGKTRGLVSRDVDGLHLEARDVVLDGQIKLTPIIEDSGGRVEWEIPLYAADPHLYGHARSGQARSLNATVGLVYPWFDNAAGVTTGIFEYGSNGQTQVVLGNEGTAPACPVVTVEGDLPGGFRLIGSPGLLIEWPGAVTPQAPVTIDVATGSVTQLGVSQSYRLATATWAGVPPNSSGSWSLEALAGGTATLTVQLCNTYL